MHARIEGWTVRLPDVVDDHLDAILRAPPALGRIVPERGAEKAYLTRR